MSADALQEKNYLSDTKYNDFLLESCSLEALAKKVDFKSQSVVGINRNRFIYYSTASNI